MFWQVRRCSFEGGSREASSLRQGAPRVRAFERFSALRYLNACVTRFKEGQYHPMTARLALSYLQTDAALPVVVSKRLEPVIVRLGDFRSPHTKVEEALAAVIGTPRPMSSVLGVHPDYPDSVHPVHGSILESVLRRLTVGTERAKQDLMVTSLDTSALIIGGPLASRHAAAIFGSKSLPSALGRALPVHFDLCATQRDSTPENKAALIVDGRTTKAEHFLLTSLPMAEHRLINISALTGAGGSAADLILGNPRLMHDLYVATRPFQNGGWQALFAVRIAAGKPVAIEPQFRVFEIKGIDFDGGSYALNDPTFLRKYSEGVIPPPAEHKQRKIAKSRNSSYDWGVTSRKDLKAIINSLSKYLKQNPDQVSSVKRDVETLLATFAVVSKVQTGSAARSENRAVVRSRKRPSWSDLKARRDRNPAQFIREEYKAEIEAQELAMASVRRSDPALYQAYIGWIRPSRHPEDDLKLPRRTKRTSTELAALEGLSLEDVVRLHRLAAVARSRLLRQRVK